MSLQGVYNPAAPMTILNSPPTYKEFHERVLAENGENVTYAVWMDEATKDRFKKVAIGLMTVGGLASAYHGYKRNNSFGWGIGWGLLGTIFPIPTTSFAMGQGYGKRGR
jgi:hypothetical protein